MMIGATGGHPVVLCRGICKTFQEGKLSVEVLKGVDFEVARREQVAVVGASGSGKSTLLHILGGLDAPSSGDLLIDNNDVSKMTQKARGTLRNHVLGFVYQFHHLLPEFTALENVAMPLLIRKDDDKRAVEDAEEILVRVGLQDRMAHKPAELSGGERQRAAIARAMVTRPRCIMADEPTGNLDSKTADAIHELLVELNQENGTALVVVTHDMNLARKMGRIVRIENGHLADSPG